MHLGSKKPAESAAFPLRGAVLCVDCESVTDSKFDECLVCGSRSLLSLARLLGGTLQSRAVKRSSEDKNIVLFDLQITIDLKQIESKDLNAAVEGITSLINGPKLGRGRAYFHINVEPVVESSSADESKAA